MAALSTDEKLALMLPFLVKAKLVADPPPAQAVETVRKVIEASGDRLKVAGDILAYADFFLVDEPPMDGARGGPHEGALETAPARLASRCSCSFHRSRSICRRFMDGPVEAFTRASLSAEY